MWVNLLSATVVDGRLGKCSRARAFGTGSEDIAEGISSKKQPWICHRCGDRESVRTSSITVESVMYVIAIDISDSVVAEPISAASKHTADMEVDGAGATPKTSVFVHVGLCTVSEGGLGDDDRIPKVASSLALAQRFCLSAIIYACTPRRGNRSLYGGLSVECPQATPANFWRAPTPAFWLPWNLSLYSSAVSRRALGLGDMFESNNHLFRSCMIGCLIVLDLVLLPSSSKSGTNRSRPSTPVGCSV